MANVAILGQMGGSGISTIETHQLVERVTFGKMWIQLLAKFTESSGLNLETPADN